VTDSTLKTHNSFKQKNRFLTFYSGDQHDMRKTLIPCRSETVISRF